MAGARDEGDDESTTGVGGGAADTPGSRTDAAPPAVPGESARAPAPAPLDWVGPYHVLRTLGEGAQGTVYLAEDTRLARRVALKTLSRALVRSEHMRSRFRREAAAAARLDHPGICTVYEADADGEIPFIAMRFVEGRSLADLIDDSRPDPGRRGSSGTRSDVVQLPRTAEASSGAAAGDAPAPRGVREDVLRVVELFEHAARALHVAHEAGLIHRDVKPDNIMVTPEGAPVLLDFGLARDTDSDEERPLTDTGTLVGTPAYMSPEQLFAFKVPIDRRTDVYSLGVALFESLALRRPFDAPTREALYQQILMREAPPLRRVNRAVPSDLDVVVQTAMQKERDRRYQTALDLAEDLRRVRERLPIRARPAGRVLRLRRWAQRNPGLALALTAVLVSLSAGLAVSLTLLADAREEERAKSLALVDAARQRRAKDAALADAVAAARRAEGLRLAAVARQLVEEDPAVAVAVAVEASSLTDSSQVKDALFAALDEYVPVLELAGHEGYVEALDLSPDGTRIVGGDEDVAILWDARDGTLLRRLEGQPGAILAATFSPRGDVVATASRDGTLRIWDVPSGNVVRDLGHPARPRTFEFTEGGDAVVAGFADGTVVSWDVRSGAERWRNRITGAGYPLLVADEGRRVVVGRGDAASVILDARTGKVEREDRPVPEWGGPRAELLISPARRLVASTRAPSGLDVFDAATGAVVGRAETAKRLRWAHPRDDGRTALVVDLDLNVREVDLTTGSESAPFARGQVFDISADGRTAAVGYEFDVAVVDLPSRRTLHRLRGHRYSVTRARFSRDGSKLVTASKDRAIRVWDLGTVGRLRALQTSRPRGWHYDGVDIDAGRVSGWRPAEGGDPVRVEVVSVADGRTLMSVPVATDARAVRVSLAASVLCEGAANRLTVRTVPDGRVLWAAEGVAALPYDPPKFSPDGSLLAVPLRRGTDDALLRVFETATGRVAAEWPIGQHWIAGWSPDLRRVALAGGYTGVRILELANGAVTDLPGHRGMVMGAAFSPDGRRIASTAVDSTARVYDLAKSAEVACVAGLPMSEEVAMWCPDGRTVCAHGRVFFDADTGRVLGALEQRQPWRVRGFADGGRSLVLVSTDAAGARILPADPLAFVRDHPPPELMPRQRARFEIGTEEDRRAKEDAWSAAHPTAWDRLQRGRNALSRGELGDAVAAGRAAAGFRPQSRAAQTFLAAALSRRAAGGTGASREADLAAALDAVAAALRLGVPVQSVADDPDLATLRADPRFAALVGK